MQHIPKSIWNIYTDKKGGWLNKESKSIFAGKFQKDLFIFAMAIGKYRQKKSPLKPSETGQCPGRCNDRETEVGIVINRYF